MSFDPEVVIKDRDMVDLILDHLYQHGHLKTMRALEEETGRTVFRYGKDVMFFRGLVLDGRWEDVEHFIQPLEGMSTQYKEALYYLRRQRFLEMLDKSDDTSDLTEVTELLKSMEDLCTQENFHSLCYCLTLPTIQNHPDFAKWSEFSGRMQCFTTVVEFLESIFPDQTTPSSRVPPRHLISLCKQAVILQADAYFLCHPDEEIPETITAELCAEKFNPWPLPRSDSGTAMPFESPTRKPPPSAPKTSAMRQTVHSAGGLADAFPPVPRRGNDDVVRSMDSKVARPPKPKENSSLKEIIQAKKLEKKQARKTDQILKEDDYGNGFDHSPPTDKKPSKGLAWDLDVGDFKGDKVTRPPREGLRSPKEGERAAGQVEDHWDMDAHNNNADNRRQKAISERGGPTKNLERGDNPPQNIHQPRPKVRAGGFASSSADAITEVPLRNRAQQDKQESSSQSEPISGYEGLSSDTAKNWSGLVLLRESHPIRAVSFSPNGQYFAFGTNNKVLAVGSAPYSTGNRQLPRTEMLVERSDYHRGSVYCLSWDSSSEFIATGSNDKSIKICRISTDSSGDVTSSAEEDFVLRGHTGTIRDLCFTPVDNSGLILSAGAGDCRPRLWDLASGSLEPVALFDPHAATVFCTKFSEDGSVALTAGQDGIIKIWDFRQGKQGGHLITDLDVATGAILAACFKPGSHNREIATSHGDGSCQIWDLRQQEHLLSLNNHTEEVRTLHFSPGGEMLLTGSFDSHTTLYNSTPTSLDTYEFLTTLQGHSGRILQASFHPKEPCILTSSADCSIMYWKPERPKI